MEIGDICNEDKLPKEIKILNYKYNEIINELKIEDSDKKRKIDELDHDKISQIEDNIGNFDNIVN